MKKTTTKNKTKQNKTKQNKTKKQLSPYKWSRSHDQDGRHGYQ